MTYIPIPNPLTVAFGGQTVDAFSRLRVSTPNTLFDSQQEYGLCTRRCWDGVVYNGAALYTITNPSSNGSITDASGNAVGPRETNSRMVPVTVSTTNGHYAILQTRQYFRYIPGKGHLIFFTGVFAAGSGATIRLVKRTGTSGSVVDTKVDKSSWNIDTFDGSGNAANPSGILMDFTKTQIMFISAQWLGVGRVMIGFDIDGVLYPAHQFLGANNITVPYTQTFNLPFRIEHTTGANSSVSRFGYFETRNGIFLETERTSKGGTVYFNCVSVQSEGGIESRGDPHSVGLGTTSVAVTTRRPLISIRPSATYNALNNRAHIEEVETYMKASTNDSYYEIVIGGVLNATTWLRKGEAVTAGSFVVGIRYVIRSVGTTDFTLIGASANTIGVSFAATGVGVGTGTAVQEDSCTEYNTDATTISGGVVVNSGYVPSGSGVVTGEATSFADLRSPLTLSLIDSLTVTQLPISIVCTSVTGTSNVSCGFRWHEQVI